MPDEEFETLLSRALLVLNRYCQLFAAETYSVNMIGHDDYRFVFSSVAAAVEQLRGKTRDILKSIEIPD